MSRRYSVPISFTRDSLQCINVKSLRDLAFENGYRGEIIGSTKDHYINYLIQQGKIQVPDYVGDSFLYNAYIQDQNKRIHISNAHDLFDVNNPLYQTCKQQNCKVIGFTDTTARVQKLQPGLPCTARDYQRRIDQVEDEIRQRQHLLQEVENRISKIEDSVNEINSSLQGVQNRIQQNTRAAETYQRLMPKYSQDLASLNRRLQDLQQPFQAIAGNSKYLRGMFNSLKNQPRVEVETINREIQRVEPIVQRYKLQVQDFVNSQDLLANTFNAELQALKSANSQSYQQINTELQNLVQRSITLKQKILDVLNQFNAPLNYARANSSVLSPTIEPQYLKIRQSLTAILNSLDTLQPQIQQAQLQYKQLSPDVETRVIKGGTTSLLNQVYAVVNTYNNLSKTTQENIDNFNQLNSEAVKQVTQAESDLQLLQIEPPRLRMKLQDLSRLLSNLIVRANQDLRSLKGPFLSDLQQVLISYQRLAAQVDGLRQELGTTKENQASRLRQIIKEVQMLESQLNNLETKHSTIVENFRSYQNKEINLQRGIVDELNDEFTELITNYQDLVNQLPNQQAQLDRVKSLISEFNLEPTSMDLNPINSELRNVGVDLNSIRVRIQNFPQPTLETSRMLLELQEDFYNLKGKVEEVLYNTQDVFNDIQNYEKKIQPEIKAEQERRAALERPSLFERFISKIVPYTIPDQEY